MPKFLLLLTTYGFQTWEASWHKALRRHDLYFEGLIDSGNLESILEEYKRSTITSYGTRTSSNVTAPQAAIKSEKTAVDSAKDNKRSVTVKKAVNKNKV